ncbi:hypothetical protein E2C01_004095 [Portunus trituberculatus]|uniref:Uncharacterized protein n=1 Tax=Portunus trituberculatus TaxID=210409 RepID=A0A5B7CPQ5_PORTR|nr:hypothetical protein [Portunus trituberculatus]
MTLVSPFCITSSFIPKHSHTLFTPLSTPHAQYKGGSLPSKQTKDRCQNKGRIIVYLSVKDAHGQVAPCCPNKSQTPVTTYPRQECTLIEVSLVIPCGDRTES